MLFLRLFILALLLAAPLQADYLYKTLLLRAAPGKLLNLIELYKNRMDFYEAAGDEKPFIMRHSQGDQWDLLLLFPIKNYRDYYSPSRIESREMAARKIQVDFAQKFKEYVAWHEEVVVLGASLAEVQKSFTGMQFFHVEMFIALPGKHDELYKQRQMENTYLEKLDRPQNLIFTHDQGAAWDIFTIGCYRDLKHFA
ncbi:hypothetical protein IID10_21345, partial [candidate division KSB1 bacterium]|nr:hypothetical protein [candidate division KSB1 bacterium]